MTSWFVRALFGFGIACTAGTAPAAAAPFSALYAFGDSLSDVGNVFLGTGFTIPGAPYFAGRFSNGPNWLDDFSAKLGLGQVIPALAGGNDFAFGGAVTGPAVPAPPPSVPNVVQQVGLFSVATGGVAPSTGLYTVWIGSNDIFNALDALLAGTLTVPQAKADIVTAAQTAAGAVKQLVDEGATTFLIPLVSDLGKTPNVLDFPPLISTATDLSIAYNSALIASIAAATAGDPVTVRYLDTFSLINAAVADPGAFGFTEVTDRCYIGPLTGGGSVCATPDTYLFWDGQHPTAAADALVADFAQAAVLPEPSTLAIVFSAGVWLFGLGAKARRGSASRQAGPSA